MHSHRHSPFVAFLFFVFLTFSAGAFAQGLTVRSPHGLNGPVYHLFESESLGRPFHVFVRLPADYETTTRKWPVVYLLDGGHTFPMLAGYSSYLVMAGDMLDMIVVGLSYGTNDWRKGNLRSTDFTAPAQNRDHYGGAGRFLDFLKSELLPFMEGRYEIDPDQRVLFGQSLGGQFVLYTALHEPKLFQGMIASNPALHRNLDYFLKPKASAEPGSGRLFVSSGTKDDPRFRGPTAEWIQVWVGRADLPWTLKVVDLPGQNHFSAAPEAYRLGLKWIFAGRVTDNE